MLGRIPVFLLAGALFAAPALSSAAPTAGAARVYFCEGQSHGFCEDLGGENARGGLITAWGSLNLDGGSYTGGFWIRFTATKGQGLNYRFENAAVAAGPVDVPYDMVGLELPADPPIQGSCSGTISDATAALIIRMECSFQDSGVSGNRRLLVAVAYDGETVVEDAVIGSGPPCFCPSHTGVYALDYARRL